jgi:hypothetical protein
VGTRRLPYVGDRVGGLGVRPPALALKGIGPYIWQLKTFCARALHFSRIPVRSLRTPVEPVTALAPAEAFTEMLPPMLPPRPLAARDRPTG